MQAHCSVASMGMAATFILAAFAGCGGAAASKPPRSATPATVVPQTTAEELTAPAGELKFGALRLFQGAELGLTLGTDGSIDVPGRGVVGRLEHDGRFVDAHEKTLLRLMPEGELVLPSGDYLPVTMDKDGTVHLLKEGRVVRLTGDGTLEGANPSGPVIRVEGVAPATQRTAMFLLVLASYPILNHP